MNKGDKWIKKVLVHRILQNINKSVEVKLQECAVIQEESNKNNWASTVCCMNITYNEGEVSKLLSLIVKLMEVDIRTREIFSSNERFSNEIHFYMNALPLMLSRIEMQPLKQDLESLFPQCYYACCTDNDSKLLRPEDGVVALGNLKCLNFKLANRDFLDLQHLMLAVDCLGSFHAMSYFMKEKYGDEFHSKVVPPISEIFVRADYKIRVEAANITSSRAVKLLEKELEENHKGLRVLKKVTEDPFPVLQKLLEPQEPLAVLCHGDYLRNNLLFRYDDSGSPEAMTILDFQTIVYGSPSIDLSVLLFTSSNHETRMEHTYDLLRKYHMSVVHTLAVLLEEDDHQVAQRYEYTKLVEDFREHAMFGYFVAVFLIPFMFSEEAELVEYSKYLKEEACSPAFTAKAMSIGGERVNAILLSVAKDLLDVCFP